MKNTTRAFAVIGLTALLAGCSLPLQVAALAVDGFSLLTTKKTISDHGISAVANKDCAVWRGVTGGEICRDPDDGETAIAENKGENSAEAKAGLNAPLNAPVTSEPLQAVAAPAKKQTEFPPRRYQAPRYRAAGKIKTAAAKTAVADTGLHLVLASFKNPINANRFALKNPGVKTRLVKAWVKGRPMYRVMVGPLAPRDRAAMRTYLTSIGIRGAWPVRLGGSAGPSQLAAAR